MTEIFVDIPPHVKRITQNWVDFALLHTDIIQAIKIIKEFRDTCESDEEKAFLDFYVDLRMEQLNNENNND